MEWTVNRWNSDLPDLGYSGCFMSDFFFFNCFSGNCVEFGSIGSNCLLLCIVSVTLILHRGLMTSFLLNWLFVNLHWCSDALNYIINFCDIPFNICWILRYHLICYQTIIYGHLTSYGRNMPYKILAYISLFQFRREILVTTSKSACVCYDKGTCKSLPHLFCFWLFYRRICDACSFGRKTLWLRGWIIVILIQDILDES